MCMIVYACVNMEPEICSKSSSGGVFPLAAKSVINEGGVVFGARFDHEWEVIHDVASTFERVEAFLGSKYLESKIGNTYAEAEKYLKNGQKVLFSGTPCQIAGLKSYLRGDHENLITVDLVCHGVPSRLIWKQYLQRTCGNKKIKNVFFRDKTNGWLDYSLKVELEEGGYIQKPRNLDLFMRGFIQGAYLRPSCYSCCFQSGRNMSDLTMGDFWKVNQICPDMYNEMGTSLVFVRTEKGKKLFEEISKFMKVKQIAAERIETENLVEKPSYRDALFDRSEKEILSYVAAQTRPSYGKIIVKRIKKSLRKLIKG